MKPDTYSACVRRTLIGTGALLACFIMSLSPSVTRAQRPTEPKRILALYWYHKDYPGTVLFDRGFQAGLQSAPEGTVEYYPEYMETNRWPEENVSRLLPNYLRQKYADRTIDVIVAVGHVPLKFLLEHRNDLFPQTPIVFNTALSPMTKLLTASSNSNATGLVSLTAYRKSLDLALRLHPETEQVFIISGTLEQDKTFETQARDELQSYESKVQITYFTDLLPGELIVKMKSLPKRSIILYIWQQSGNDRSKLLESVDNLALIAQSASVPVYSLTGRTVSQGITGGYFYTAEANAGRVAEMALQIANGARTQDIPVEEATTIPMFDWRELQRWGISEDKLPPDSVVRFKELSFWEQYRWRIIGVVSLCAAQALLITILLVEGRRRRLAKEALDRLNCELEQRVVERTVALEAKTSELEAFSYSVAHDLKAPLRGIDGYSRLLLENYSLKLDEDGSYFLSTIRASTERMYQMIDDLLAYSRLERRALSSSNIELCSFVQTIVEEKRSELEERKVKLEMNINGSTVTADIDGLAQAMRNYLDNAIKFTHNTAEPSIEIGAEEGEKSVCLWVRDNGVGFDMKYHDKIFEIFQRLHRMEEHPGTGIGLALVRKAMERMGGRAWAESRVGQGATFYLEIPKH